MPKKKENSKIMNIITDFMPFILDEKIKITSPHFEVALEKEPFIDAIFSEYKFLIECEKDLEIDEQLTLTFDTDFAGCSDENVFKIQDNEQSNCTDAVFIYFLPENDEKTDSPKTIEKVVSWEDTKLWCEILLLMSGYGEKLLELQNSLSKDTSNEETKTLDSFQLISVFPNSSIDHHSVWIELENEMISISHLDFSDVIEFLSYYNLPDLLINSVYDDNESIIFSWCVGNCVEVEIKKESDVLASVILHEEEEIQLFLDGCKKLYDVI